MRDRRQARIILLLFVASSIWCQANARIVINEKVSKMQWAAIALIAGGTAVLSAT